MTISPIQEIAIATLLGVACSVLMARYLRAGWKEKDALGFRIPLLVAVLCLFDTAGIGVRESFKGRFTPEQNYFAMFAFLFQYVLGTAAVFRKMSPEELEEVRGRKPLLPPPLGAPGATLYRLGAWVYSRQTFEADFAPVLAAMQREIFEALAAKQFGKAQWVRARGTAAFWSQVIQHLPLLQQVVTVIKSLAKGRP